MNRKVLTFRSTLVVYASVMPCRYREDGRKWNRTFCRNHDIRSFNEFELQPAAIAKIATEKKVRKELAQSLNSSSVNGGHYNAIV